ncbi:MAG: hypothetical protein LBD41_01590 [Clostridiales Family XIII bacterium]|jgi:hypothetical protein|nr:hypothetical protein [Clostridiales Family XIII bacterium]
MKKIKKEKSTATKTALKKAVMAANKTKELKIFLFNLDFKEEEVSGWIKILQEKILRIEEISYVISPLIKRIETKEKIDKNNEWLANERKINRIYETNKRILGLSYSLCQLHDTVINIINSIRSFLDLYSFQNNDLYRKVEKLMFNIADETTNTAELWIETNKTFYKRHKAIFEG